jgi:hypothetical protein
MEFAALLRRFYNGRITNDELEDASWPLVQRDHAVAEIFKLGAWSSYSDNREYRLVGRDALSRDGRREVARWILFLKTDKAYVWPQWPHFSKHFSMFLLITAILLGALWHGWIGALLAFLFVTWPLAYGDNLYGRKKWEKLATAENHKVWPFISKAQYVAALRNPPYLCGARR